MNSNRPRRFLIVAAVILAAIAIGVGIYASSYLGTATNSQIGSSETSTESTSCSISSEPGPFLLRIISDSNQTPVVGAQVMATNNPIFCGDSPARTQVTLAFTTNGTEWYSLSGEDNLGYSIVITYSGQTYTFTERLQPVSVTCTTYFIPSGITNVTTSGPLSTCG
jgi:hypothetical protein